MELRTFRVHYQREGKALWQILVRTVADECRRYFVNSAASGPEH